MTTAIAISIATSGNSMNLMYQGLAVPAEWSVVSKRFAPCPLPRPKGGRGAVAIPYSTKGKRGCRSAVETPSAASSFDLRGSPPA